MNKTQKIAAFIAAILYIFIFVSVARGEAVVQRDADGNVTGKFVLDRSDLEDCISAQSEAALYKKNWEEALKKLVVAEAQREEERKRAEFFKIVTIIEAVLVAVVPIGAWLYGRTAK